ncbi:MBL fold metallo-hydrolase [Paracoccus suum]|uniref:MBL fold metallo-hydrolase n=2 Tax=Paracoccus suum TaxID=2259340 RepID=A0A344PNS6_9RHOB|nr:MBL fold metallo-hydrolase [Paracoccus suum]
MRLPLPMRLDHVNIYALADDDGWTVIDTGFDDAPSRAQWAALRAGPLAGRVARVLVTHSHADHVGRAGALQVEGAEVLMSRTAWLTARMLWLDQPRHPPPEQLQFWRAAGMPAEMLARRATERPWHSADVAAPLRPGFRRLQEGQCLTLGSRRWAVRMGEGHAAEHATLWSDDGIVIGGDQLLPRISPNLGVYPTEPLADPVGDWMDSCARLARFARPDQLVLPGHGLPFTGLPFRLAALIGNHRAALDRLVSVLAEAPRTAVGCFDVLYRRRIGEGEFGLALVEAVAHINRLRAEGLIEAAGTTADGGTLWGATGAGAASGT